MLTSTTYVGCTREMLVEPLARRGLIAGENIHVAFSPERIDPGNVVHAQESTPRVVGGITRSSADAAVAVLSGYANSLHVVSSAEAAEMTKLYENTFRAVNIALANEFADISRTLDLDALEVIEAAATKPYGFMPFYPGPGVGGHCIPCDPHYLLWQLRRERQVAPVIESAMSAVALRPRQVVARVKEVLGEAAKPLAGSRILLEGVTYKPGVADVRESPALEILTELAGGGAQVAFHDPLIRNIRLGEQELVSVADPATETWDLVVVHTLQPETDHDWIVTDAPLVLDTTYRLPTARREVL
jgi:nucleotide sugar dehydrogenase